MLLHFHRKALALESIEGVDSDHIVIDGLTVVETSLQEGGLGIIQLETNCSRAVFCSLTLFISPRRSWLSAATR